MSHPRQADSLRGMYSYTNHPQFVEGVKLSPVPFAGAAGIRRFSGHVIDEGFKPLVILAASSEAGQDHQHEARSVSSRAVRCHFQPSTIDAPTIQHQQDASRRRLHTAGQRTNVRCKVLYVLYQPSGCSARRLARMHSMRSAPGLRAGEARGEVERRSTGQRVSIIAYTSSCLGSITTYLGETQDAVCADGSRPSKARSWPQQSHGQIQIGPSAGAGEPA